MASGGAVSVVTLVVGACGRSSDGPSDAPVRLAATTLFTGSFPTVPLTTPGPAKVLENGASWCPPQRVPDAVTNPFVGASVSERNLGALVAYAAQPRSRPLVRGSTSATTRHGSSPGSRPMCVHTGPQFSRSSPTATASTYAAPSRLCAAVPTVPTRAAMAVTVTLTDAVIVAGADTDATVTVRNDGPACVEFDTGGLQGVVVRRGTRDVVGVSTMAVAAYAEDAVLEPGASRQFPAAVGTAACDPHVGHTPPPGDYEIIVTVGTGLQSEPAPLTLTA
jgi:hypothetical protein